MYAVVETAGFVAADTAQHGGTIELCNKQRNRYGNNSYVSYMDAVNITFLVSVCQTS